MALGTKLGIISSTFPQIPSFNNIYSLAFDGVDDVLETPVLAPIETQLWTLSTWVKWDNLTGSNEAIFSTRQNGLASSTGFDLYITDSGGNLRARNLYY